jgi:hypothetical protein
MNIPDEAVMVVEYSWGTYYETGTRIWIEAAK